MVDNKIDPRGVSAWRAFLVTHSLLEEHVDRYLESQGYLPSASIEILTALADASDGALRMSDLARSVAMSPSGLTRHADRLAKESLIERVACPADRRATYAVIQDAGRNALLASKGAYEEAIHKFLLEPLDCSDIQNLDRALAKIRAHFCCCPKTSAQSELDGS